METLAGYIWRNDPQCMHQLCMKRDSDLTYSKQVNFLLENVLIRRGSLDPIALPLELTKPTSNYLNFINLVLCYLVDSKRDNTLTSEFSRSIASTCTPNELFSPNNSFRSNYIKQPGWESIFHAMQQDQFVRLLCDYCGFIQEAQKVVQLFGPKGTNSKQPSLKISRLHMMHKTKEEPHKDDRILRIRPRELLNEIHPLAVRGKNVPKRLRRLYRLLCCVLVNDRRLDYSKIELALSYKGDSDHTQPLVVAQIVSEILLRLFPTSFWGLRKTKEAILLKIQVFIESPKTEPFRTRQFHEEFETTCFTWAGKTNRITSLQDSRSRRGLINKVFHWFFLKMTSRVIANFWHVTQKNQDGFRHQSLLYYPHSTWNRLLEPHMEVYKREYLRVANFEGKIHKTNLVNTGFIRAIKKADGFRFLCVPTRMLDRSEPWKFDPYECYVKEYIGPVRQLLLQKLANLLNGRKCHPSCDSNEDVLQNLAEFKRRSQSNISYFMMKFDMKKCYDNIDQTMIMKSVCDLFAGDDESVEYLIRQSKSLPSLGSKKRRKYSTVIDSYSIELSEPGFIDPFRIHKDFCLHRDCLHPEEHSSQTKRMSKRQVLEFVHDQIRNTATIIEETSKTSYRRKKGVFQGFPLLAVLCHVLYSSLMDDVFGFILRHPNSILLRVVDDFLLVTSDILICEATYKAANSERAKSYGAFLNRSKSSLAGVGHNSYMSFLGLTFATKTLELRLPDAGASGIDPSEGISILSQGKIMTRCFISKVRFCLLNRELLAGHSIIDYLLNNLDLILQACTTRYDASMMEVTSSTLLVDQFGRVILNLLQEIEMCLKLENKSTLTSALSDMVSRKIYGQHSKLLQLKPLTRDFGTNLRSHR